MRPIDANALIAEMHNVILEDGEDRRIFYEVIERQPTIEPERKKGKWIDAVLPNDNGGLPVQVCDQCNTFFPLAYTGGGHRFCPNCGSYNGGAE